MLLQQVVDRLAQQDCLGDATLPYQSHEELVLLGIEIDRVQLALGLAHVPSYFSYISKVISSVSLLMNS